MDFIQAQAKFEWLEQQLKSGAISTQQYQAGLNELRVTDAWGRLWMPQAQTGIWHIYNNGVWTAAQPPVQTPVQPPSPPLPLPAFPIPDPQPAYRPVAAAQPAPQVRPGLPRQQPKESSLFFKYLRGFLIWVAIWVVIGAGLWIFYASKQGEEGPQIMLGLGAAALLSLVLMLGSMSGSWKGQVAEIRIITETSTDEDGDAESEQVRYAFIRQTNGKMRRERAMPDWQAGDWLEKKQGENWVRKL